MPWRSYLTLLGAYLAPQWPRALLLAVVLFSGIALDLAFPQIVRHFIDSARAGAPVAALLGAAALYLGLALVAQGVVAAQEYVATDVGQRATNAMRSALTLHCLRLDPAFHHRHTPGELIERIDGDVGVLSNFFSRLVIDLLGNVLLLLGVLILLFGIDWRLGAAYSGLTLGAIALARALQDQPVPHRRAARQASAELYGFLEERLAGTEDIRASGAIAYTLRGFHARLRNLANTHTRADAMAAATIGATSEVMVLGTLLAFVLGAWLFARGEITLGTVYLLLAYAGQLQAPVRRIGRQAQDLASGTASLARIQELFDQRSAVRDGDGPPLPPGPLSLSFEHVTFSYAGASPDQRGGGPRDVSAPPAIHDVSFALAPGEVLGLLGRTGSGKTTVSRLLLRLYDPTAGAIRLGGVDLRQTRVADVRRRVGLVTQEVHLFHASVRDNLTFFDRTVPDSRILEALRDLELSAWIDALPAGLDTWLAPGGGNLSAGEAQLLAFARVFLQDPGLVVLDEASSRLDPGTERRIERAVDRLLAGRTAIVIAHRVATVERAGQVLILDNGSVLESGPRAGLAADPGSHFSKLLRSGSEVVG